MLYSPLERNQLSQNIQAIITDPRAWSDLYIAALPNPTDLEYLEQLLTPLEGEYARTRLGQVLIALERSPEAEALLKASTGPLCFGQAAMATLHHQTPEVFHQILNMELELEGESLLEQEVQTKLWLAKAKAAFHMPEPLLELAQKYYLLVLPAAERLGMRKSSDRAKEMLLEITALLAKD